MVVVVVVVKAYTVVVVVVVVVIVKITLLVHFPLVGPVMQELNFYTSCVAQAGDQKRTSEKLC